MTWDVDVKDSGRYRAEVHYTCPQGEEGSTIELSLGSAAVAAKITEAFDPPLRGDENDRVPRVGESLVKEFRPLDLGVIELPAGRGALELKAKDLAGKQVADLRFVMLRRIP